MCDIANDFSVYLTNMLWNTRYGLMDVWTQNPHRYLYDLEYAKDIYVYNIYIYIYDA